MWKRRETWGVMAALVAVLLPALAAVRGARGPLCLELDLGPGDSPYIEGFLPDYEVEGREGTHWTTYDASIRMPLAVRGGPVDITYRYARIWPQTAEVELYLGPSLIDRFSRRGGIFEVRRVNLAAVNEAPLLFSIRADSHERRNMGIKLDWFRVELGERARVSLIGWQRFRAALLVAILWLFFRLVGWSVVGASTLTMPWAIAAAYGLLTDPWLTHRVLTGFPVAIALYASAVAGIGRVLVRLGKASWPSLKAVSALMMTAFVLRALLVSHPGFYHPDLRTHALMVETVRRAGFDFLSRPAFYIEQHGVWKTEAYGRSYAFPYPPAFHLPLSLVPASYDAMLTVMKLAGAAWSTVPIALVWALARRFEVSPLGAGLMVLIPTYTSRLSFAFFPALFGHAVDMALIYWLVSRFERIGRAHIWVAGAFVVAASQLAYVSGVLNVTFFLALLALVQFLRRRPEAVRRGLAVLGMTFVASLISIAIYYRDFLGMLLDVLPRMAGGAAGAPSRYPVRGWLEVIVQRTRDFFDGIYPPLALGGLPRLAAHPVGGDLVLAWIGTYFLLLLGRARIPDIFLHGHETLFLTPLVCLAAGALLGLLYLRAGWKRGLAVVLFAALAVQGLVEQWRFIAAQLTPPAY